MSRRTVLRILIGGVLVALMLAPGAAHAEDVFPIVRCGLEGQPPCAPCDIWATFKRLIDLLLTGITIPIAAFMIVYAGIMYLLAAGNPGKLQAAKTLLTNTFIGVGIILGAWLVTNFLIKSLARGNVADEWYKFSCPTQLTTITNIETEFPPEGGTVAQPAQGTGVACNKTLLAAAYDVPPTPTVAQSLGTLMQCLEADPVIAQMIDKKNTFTFEEDNEFCNYTRGTEPSCGNSCSHASGTADGKRKPSCHYGGAKGSQGAMAVDWNWNKVTVAYKVKDRSIYPGGKCPSPPTPAPSGQPSPTPIDCRIATGEHGLFDELYRAAKKRNCSYKLLNFETTKTGQHSHMSTTDCDADIREPAAGRATPSPMP